MYKTTCHSIRSVVTLSVFLSSACLSGRTPGDDQGAAESAVLSPVGETFSASGDFAGFGWRGWSYKYGTSDTPTEMSFVPANPDVARDTWKGNERYSLLWADGGHPGASSQSIRRWTANQAGTIEITGNAWDADPSCGDGVVVSILENTGTVLWQSTIANGNTSGNTFDVTTPVSTGTTIDFVIDNGGTNFCDSTGFNPTIHHTITGGSVPDLTITGIRTDPAAPTPGAPVRFYTRVKNIGTCSVDAGSWLGLSYLVDGVFPPGVWAGTTSGLAPGQEIEIGPTGPWTASAGTHTATARIDDQHILTESNEGNNTLDATLSVLPQVCTPGSVEDCGCTGMRTCNASGSGWGVCRGDHPPPCQ